MQLLLESHQAGVQSFYKRYQNDAAKHRDDTAQLAKRLAALEGARS